MLYLLFFLLFLFVFFNPFHGLSELHTQRISLGRWHSHTLCLQSLTKENENNEFNAQTFHKFWQTLGSSLLLAPRKASSGTVGLPSEASATMMSCSEVSQGTKLRNRAGFEWLQYSQVPSSFWRSKEAGKQWRFSSPAYACLGISMAPYGTCMVLVAIWKKASLYEKVNRASCRVNSSQQSHLDWSQAPSHMCTANRQGAWPKMKASILESIKISAKDQLYLI